MKTIFKILISFISLLSPTIVTAVTCDVYTSPNDCNATPGCGWLAGMSSRCYECNSNQYNEGGQNSTGCKTCATEQSNVYTWDSSYQGSQLFVQNSVFDSTNAARGQTSCPWICDTDYYEDNNQCIHCPNLSSTDSTNGATSINQCTCNSSYFKYYNRSDSWISSAGCMAAPSGNNNGWVLMTVNSESVYKCATHATLNGTGTQNPTCTCPNDSLLSGNDCVCNMGYRWTGTTDNFSCTRCPDDSSPVNGTCECNAGYYGNANGASGSCTHCPAGYTSDPGSNTQRSNCYMDSNTEFCDANGNCMKLLHDLSGRIIAPNP